MLIGFGGPESSLEVRPFLDRVLSGRPVPRERYEEVVHHYQSIGGGSPYNELTRKQAAALAIQLRADGSDAPVVAGMRNSAPFIEDSLRELHGRGISRVFGFIMAAFRCEASWDRYRKDVESAQARIGVDAPAVEYPGAWHTHPLFIGAIVDRIREAFTRIHENKPGGDARLIFTAHSVPESMASQSGYVEQLNETASIVAAALGRSSFTLAFQSRSGNPHDAWLEPDIGTVLRNLEARAAVVMPLGFLCDHVEVLYDLDIEARTVAREAGVMMERAGTVGIHPKFIQMMAEIIRPRLSASH
jgi:ferrochelatase